MQPEELPVDQALSVRASDVSIRPVEWLWECWILRGKTTVLDDHSGFATSTIMIDLAAMLGVSEALRRAVAESVLREINGW